MGIEKLTGGKKAFVNFTRNLLLKQVPCLFSPKILFSELLEPLEPDEELIAAIIRMNNKGCRFALDDFIFHEKFEPLMRFAKIIKIDIQQTPLEEAKLLIDRLAGRPIKFLAESKPGELIRASVVRARLCELAGRESDYQGDLSELFLLELFSLMNAVLETEMEQIIDQLPLSDHLKLALVKKEGELAKYLEVACCCEKGRWNEMPEGILTSLTMDKYIEAVGWADTLIT